VPWIRVVAEAKVSEGKLRDGPYSAFCFVFIDVVILFGWRWLRDILTELVGVKDAAW
jgi:uncharacterized membrane protein